MGFVYTTGGGGVNTLSVPGGPPGSNGWAIVYDSGVGIMESNPETGPMATVKFKVYDANQRYSFANQLLGQWSGTPPSTIIYRGPYEYPPSPNLLCTAIPEIRSYGKWLPMGGVGLPWLFGESAFVTAVFSRPQWQPATNGGYFSINFAAAGEFLTLPETTFQFADGTPTNTPIGLLIPQSQIMVTRFRMPFIPDYISAALLGYVNNAPFSIGWNTYPPGTLLYGGMNSEVQSDPLGNITFQLQYIFQFRTVPWNYSYHPNRTTGFAYITNGSGIPPYPSGNFELLP